MIVTIFVAIFMVGTLSLYALSMMNDVEDPHETERHYAVSGTWGGVECEGTGVAKYTPENSNYHLYSYVLDLDNGETFSFGMVFLADDTPDPSLYVTTGSTEIDGKSVSIWTHDNLGVDYTFYISDFCTVEKAILVSDSMDLVLVLLSS